MQFLSFVLFAIPFQFGADAAKLFAICNFCNGDVDLTGAVPRFAAWFMQPNKKKLRVEDRPLAELFLPDLDVFDLKKLLKRNGISYKGVSRKADLVGLLQPVVDAANQNERQRRIESLGSAAAGATDSKISSSSSKSNSTTASGRFGRVPRDLIVETSQYLLFSEVAALSQSCKLLNSLCSLKLKGQPSLALAKRQIIDEREQSLARLPQSKFARLLLSLRPAEVLHGR